MSSKKNKIDEATDNAENSEECHVDTKSDTKMISKKAPSKGKRCKQSLATSDNKRAKVATESQAEESSGTSSNTTAKKVKRPKVAPIQSQMISAQLIIRRSRSAVNANAAPLEPTPTSSSRATRSRSASQKRTNPTATVTSEDAGGSNSDTSDNEPQPSSSSERRLLNLSSIGIPFVISVKKGLFADPTRSSISDRSESSTGDETVSRIPRFVASTETSGGHQRRFLPSTEAGVPLGVSIQNAVSGGQFVSVGNSRRMGMSRPSNLEREGLYRLPTPTPRPSLSLRILEAQDDDYLYNDVPIGPAWGSSLFHDAESKLQTVIHLNPLCITVRRSGCLDNIIIKPLKMGELNKHYKMRMIMLIGQSAPRWLQDRPGAVLGGDQGDECTMLCWYVYDDIHSGKITTSTIWKQLAATWPVLIGTNPRVVRRQTATNRWSPLEPAILDLPEPSELDSAHSRIMAAVVKELLSIV